MMKLLVGYDGSKSADAAIDDLVNAGLPQQGMALAVSVAEVWMPPAGTAAEGENGAVNPYVEELVKRYRANGEQAVAEAEEFAKHAQERIQSILPGWDVQFAATYGSPAWEVLNAADDFQPDLIVVGSHGRTALGRFILGSISQKILSEARCSVRISRGRIEVDASPERIVIGFDGTEGALAAVDAVSKRAWSPGSEVRLVAAGDQVTPSPIGRVVPPVANVVDDINTAETEWIQNLVNEPLEDLRAVGLSAELLIRPGNPKRILIDEAEKWDADCIFVGANKWGARLERFLIGSTSAAIAARAHCSVEVVRKPVGEGSA